MDLEHMDRWLGVEEIAEHLGVSKELLSRLEQLSDAELRLDGGVKTNSPKFAAAAALKKIAGPEEKGED